MLTLYFAPGPSSMAVHIALHEIRVPFEARATQRAKLPQSRALFRRLGQRNRLRDELSAGAEAIRTCGTV
jgi:glutathione S-transferase